MKPKPDVLPGSGPDLSPLEMKLKCLTLIVPVYNEAATILPLIERVLRTPYPKQIIIINDGSTDGTRKQLDKLEAEFTPSTDGRHFLQLKIISHSKNQGKGACIRSAIVHATGDIILIQDADLEYNPADYPILIEPILSGDADVVYGTRFLGNRRRVQYFWHMIGNTLLTLLSNMVNNLNLTDMETCYKAFKGEVLKSLPIRSNRFGVEPELTAKVAKLRCRIYEVPISYQGRTYSEGKKVNWKDGFAAVWTIFKFWIIDDLYDETAGLRTLRIMEGAGTYNKWLYEQCERHLGQRILETGSGIGNITKLLMDRDEIVATDISDFYLNELRLSFNDYQNVTVSKLDLLQEEAVRETANRHDIDTVLSLNVLEHIDDDQRALRNINRLLDLGGCFVLLVPAHQALFSDIDRHLGHFRRYSRPVLRDRLEESGFEIKELRYLNFIGALGWLVNGRILRRKLLPSRQIRAFDLIVKLLALEKWVSPPFGLSVLAVARKVREV